MRRREFIAALGSAAAWPVMARGQQQANLPIVGFLGSGTRESQNVWLTAFLKRLHELGWMEDRNLSIEYRWANGSSERAGEFATEFVRHNVAVIVTYANPMVIATKRATSLIPIIFAAAADPLGTGLVASLARPGGNVTGLSIQHTDLASKHLELLREMVPGLRRLAIMVNVENPASMLEMRQVDAAARPLNLDIATFGIRRSDEIGPALKAIKEQATDALYVCIDTLIFSNRTRITTFALTARLPTIFSVREYVEDGGLISYSANFPDLFRRAGDYVDKVLRGAKPGDIPVEQPTKFDLVINRTTAKALGINVPLSLLATADEVIE
jgi:putative ABC transport system substrate-binding protein